MMKIDQLETENLVLRMWRNEDIDPYAEMCADPDVMKYLGGKRFNRLEAWRHAAFFIGHWYLKGFGHWAVVEKRSQRFIGRIGFLYPDGWPGFELGWALSKDVWNKGYATEGAREALGYAFTRLDKEEIISLIHPENNASLKVATKLGEIYKREIEFKGTMVSLYGISKDAWKNS